MNYEEYVKEYAKTVRKAKQMSQNLILYRETGDESYLKLDNKIYYTTKEFADIVGVSLKTVQTWDNKGLVKCHHRTPSGGRMYSDDEVRQVLEGKTRRTM